ncbi:hypothetical protein [Escherichia phage ZCEC13]|uniref:Uncharacterized protein n=1 Tax=Escherichia phage ZCEC13 TaxID=2935866 RepID=A0AAE9HK71_9CAUD|nr:hypothetical protein [Escherichia phage ZCEC13]
MLDKRISRIWVSCVSDGKRVTIAQRVQL